MDNFDAALAENVILLTPFSAFSDDEQVVSFVEKYKAVSGGVELTAGCKGSYAAVIVYVDD